MTHSSDVSLPPVTITATDRDALATAEGRIAVLATPEGVLDPVARKLDRLARGAISKLLASPRFSRLKEGESASVAWPAGLGAEAIDVVKLASRADTPTLRKAGGTLGRGRGKAPLVVVAGSRRRAAEILLGAVLGSYAFDRHRKAEDTEAPGVGAADRAEGGEPDTGRPAPVTLMVNRPEEAAAAWTRLSALAEGVWFARDLVNEPANVLTTTEFARRVAEMEALGLEVEILEEDTLEALGMRCLLAVGQGSASPSKVAVIRWQGGPEGAAPLALVGKGVVFDTGGISIKPAQGMEEMTMDMGGAAVVAGVMRSLALRRAEANVVGLLGLVENMPSGSATRPGDVVRSMKGETVEIINTDAEGRLVLADVLWYAQERFAPAAIVDLATLTGAMIIALGHAKAGVFANDQDFAQAFLRAAGAEGEGAWQMPLDPVYDRQLKSDIADMKNVGGRPAGSITAAQFLRRFVKDGTPWIHLDIAGVARVKEATDLAPKGATGWGVMALDRLVADRWERG